MAATEWTKTMDALLTTTADKIHKSGAVQDAISNSNPTFSEFMKKGRIKKKTSGGDQIRINLMYALNKPASYSGYDKINIAPQDGMTVAYVPWAQYAGDISIDGLSQYKNAGKEQIANLMTEKVRQLTAGWAEKFNADIWDTANLGGSHPFTDNNAKNMISIPLYVQGLSATTATTDYNIANIDQSAETWWQNQTFDGAGATSASALKKILSNAMNSLGQGPHGRPDLAIGNQGFYELYEESMQDQIRYTSKEDATMGFESMMLKSAKLMWDGFVPDPEAGVNGALAGGAVANNTLYLLNTKTMCLYVGKDHDFKPRGFQTPIDQDASTSLYLAYLQLVCDNRRKNGVIYDIPLNFS